MSIDGVINIYKEKGYTSHDVVAIVRKTLRNYYGDKAEVLGKGKLKVGHTGTLDPQAEGVLPICIGKATKISDFIAADRKRYKAVLQLGLTTDTQDVTGTVLDRQEVSLSRESVTEAIYSFVGAYWQLPPMFSAIKKNGQKLYDLARQGKVVERDKRLIIIYDIEIKEFLPDNQVLLEIDCSKGTYIRTLCHDIGQKLGCGGCMGDLIRLRTGQFHVIDSIKLDEFIKTVEADSLSQILYSIDSALQGFHKVYAVEHANGYLRNGNSVSTNYIKYGKRLMPEDKVLVHDAENNLIGLYKVMADGDAKYVKPITMLI